ncbi:Squalene--hopene cyclase [Hyella patelloides LEGE 07179]|uniref:Squalene--hopene cyclase n=1 Tax=Hyella patelloides LEGE 07179 TaxID=945734 RepID=A0A563VS53_9CYAN|nr:squalene--hopene cyclase [Hyella patelloides]VEP14255.1 Squalene--hopene cyclase [Hyella patelloides LEGE 07179]
MQTEYQLTFPQKVEQAIAASQKYLLSIQYPDGYWWAELQANVTITSEVLLLHKIWGTDRSLPLEKIEYYLRSQQQDRGGWELFYGDGGELSTSVEAYMALRLLNVPANDPALVKAKKFILQRGGISKTRIFTKFHLALIGCYDWEGIPSIPPWLMLLPEDGIFSIYDLSSWARGSTVPLIIVFDQKPVFVVDPIVNLDELYTEGIDSVKYELPRNDDWTDIFVELDNVFKLAENLRLVPLRQEGLKVAEKWILERQEATGDWGGIIPAMLNSLLALRCLNYDVADPIVERGFAAFDNFAIEKEDSFYMQSCISPVWDTAWCLRALVESGIQPNHPALVRGGKWLLDKQILDYGDWQVKNKTATPGGWAFEFDNRFYPDLDDSAVVVMALNDVVLPNEDVKQKAIARCLNWMTSMQCKSGGWAAFDLNNDKDWLNLLPYSDLKATIDPDTADVTARILEMIGQCHLPMKYSRVKSAISYLLDEQEVDGSWFGRWGVNYIYGTSGVVSGLALMAPEICEDNINRGAKWLVSCQNEDGGWGETCFSYNDPNLKGQGDSTASQTAWALIGILAAVEATGFAATEALKRGVEYLVTTQQDDGSWNEEYFTGTGFPGHFYLKYYMYQQYFPLLALGRYEKFFKGTG